MFYFDFLNFYNGWPAPSPGQEFKTAESGVGVSFNGFYKYSKELLRSQLKNLQKDSELNVGDKDSLNAELKFANLKKDFGL